MSRAQAIVDAAVATVAARGEAATTVEEVAHAAGVSKALVLYHFGSRARLLGAVAEALLAETEAGLASLAVDYPDPSARLEAVLDALFEEPLEMDRDGVRHILAFWFEAGRHARRVALVQAALKEALVAAARAGTHRRPRDHAPTLDAVTTHWTGALAAWASGVPVDFDQARAFIAQKVLEPLEKAQPRRRRR